MDFVSILAPFWYPLAHFWRPLAPSRVCFTRKPCSLHSFLPFLIYKAQHARPVVACDADPPPPARRGQGVPNQSANSDESAWLCRLQKLFGDHTSSAEPTGTDSLFILQPPFFRFFSFFGPLIKNRTSIKSSQNLKNRIPGCPKLDLGTILDDFWHSFFDQFSWSPKSRNLQHVYCENLFFTMSGLSF